MTRLLIIFFILFTFVIRGQCKKTIEEIALYHLDNLTQDGKPLKYFKYFTNGYVDKDSTDIELTFAMSRHKYKNDTLLIANSFASCEIIENKTLKQFAIPNKLRHQKQNPILNIYHFKRLTDKYYVNFVQQSDTDLGGFEVTLVMNLKGDLINYYYLGHVD